MPATPPSPNVAVIDLGSNSIKILVATRGADGGIQTLLSKSLDARISAGISKEQPRLSEQGMTRGLLAMQELLALAEPFSPERAIVVATSAVRDAQNGDEFRDQIQKATGFDVRVLSGDEEAAAIGRGLLCDPSLANLGNFYVFDLGGGSLECLSFRARALQQAISLPLGCVRLMEKFVRDPAGPLTDDARSAITEHVQVELVRGRFLFNLSAAAGIATGGTMSTVRAIIGARSGQKAEQAASVVMIDSMREMLDELAPLDLERRKRVPGLPAARADVFPTALATLLAIAQEGEFPAFRHSFCNLRFGLAAQLLSGTEV